MRGPMRPVLTVASDAVALVFPKQMEEMSNALIEIDLSAGTDNLPVRHLLFNDLRVKVFLIIN